MADMTMTRIVKKLVGNIQPAGAAHIDPERFENLKEMCKLVDDLTTEIDLVAQQVYSQQHSVKEMGKYANDFMKNQLGIQ